jgi:hypothetical protein
MQLVTIFFTEAEWKLLFRLAEKTLENPTKPYPLSKAVEYLAILAGRKLAPSDSPIGVTSVWEGLFVLQVILKYAVFVGHV